MDEHRLTTVRRARYYTEGAAGGDAPEVWIVLHGFSQLAAPFLTYFRHIATPSRLVVAPEALNRFYVQPGSSSSRVDARVGTTWMTREDRDNEILDYVDFLDAVYATTVPATARVSVLGFSQGAATAARWLAMGRSRAHRLIVWAGQLPPDLDLARLRERLDAGVVLVQGTEDEYTAWVREGGNRDRLLAASVPVENATFEGGHRMDAATLRQLAGA